MFKVHIRHAYIATFRKLGWSKVAALTQDGAKYSDYMAALQDEFQNNNIEFVMNRKFTKDATDMSMVRIPCLLVILYRLN